MLPLLCAAQSVSDEYHPLCDRSQSNSDSVSIISDTKGVDFAPYLEKVKREVKQRWYSLIPSNAIFKSGCVSIQFKILPTGTIADLHYKSTSGDSGLDRAASKAIAWPEPLPPLPAEFKGDHLELRFNFFYNLGPRGAPGNRRSEPTPAIDEAALTPGPPVHRSTQDFARIADDVNVARVNELSTTSEAPSASASTDVQIVAGRLIHRVDPKYPKDARKKNIEGSVVLLATVETNGSVTDLSIISGDLRLAEAAVDAVRQWRFDPYTQGGNLVQVQQELMFQFNSGAKFAELNLPLPSPMPSAALTSSGQNRFVANEKIYEMGRGIAAPRAIYMPGPEYSETARKTKFQGTCVLSLVVGSDGLPRDIRVTRALGKGLDEKAVETVSKWKFQPAAKNGQPVAVKIAIEVAFHLY
jgi:TonB family protein